MKECNLITLQRAWLKKKAEFEEQGKVDLSEKPSKNDAALSVPKYVGWRGEDEV